MTGERIPEGVARSRRLVSFGMIATRYNVNRETVIRARRASRDFPPPVGRLRRRRGGGQTPYLFEADAVHTWVRARRPKWILWGVEASRGLDPTEHRGRSPAGR